jgi:hypothetical protein
MCGKQDPDISHPTSVSGSEDVPGWLTLAAVLFLDGSSEGEGSIAASLRESRDAQKVQLKRMLPILQTGAEAPESTRVAAIQTAIRSIASLPETLENGSNVREKSHRSACYSKLCYE